MKQPDHTAPPAAIGPQLHLKENPEALAKHAIRVLENYILKKHDLTVPMGAELEFGVLPKAINSSDVSYGVRDAVVKRGNHTPSVFRHPKHRDPWFPESRRVAYSYQEESNDDRWDKLEVVLTHQPSDADGNAIPHNGLILARNIEALANQLHAPASGYKPSKRGKTAAHVGADYWRNFRETELAALSTDPSVAGTFNTNGLHLNMSLVDAQTNDNVLEHAGEHRNNLVATLSHSIGAMFHENAYLISSGQASITRWQWRTKPDKGGTTKDFIAHVKRKDTANYLENAIPDASANPYYAMLLQLAGTAQALDSCAFSYHETEPFYRSTPTPAIDTTRDWPTTSLHTLKEAFTNGKNLREILNHCEPELGDRFMAAIEKSPPNTALQSSRNDR